MIKTCLKMIFWPPPYRNDPPGNSVQQSASVRARLIRAWPTAASALPLMWWLKHHYSMARAETLDWILAPTARLVSWVTPLCPQFEAGVGYTDYARGVIIAPGCAGVNFMIMAFGLSAWCVLGLHRPAWRMAGLSAGLMMAYGLTIVVNTMRIAFSMVLFDLAFYNEWMTAARVHRLVGIGIYFWALWLYYHVLERIIWRLRPAGDRQQMNRPHIRATWPPYGCYLALAIGVPIVNGALAQRPLTTAEHMSTIFAALACFAAIERLAKWLTTAIQMKGNRQHARHHTGCRG